MRLLTILLTCFVFVAVAQNKPGTELPIRKAQGLITLDGKLDEPDWQRAAVAKDFYLNFPVDTAFAPFQTEARLTFDDHNFYLSFVCYDDQTPDIVQSLRRDFDYDNNDNVGFTLGPYNDRINGFFFVITPRGVQMEGTVSGGGASGDNFSATWDNKWYSHVEKYDDRWIAEIAIPFKSFRFKSNLKEWNINFIRWDRKRNLSSTWVAVPIQFDSGSFGYSGQLVWEDPSPAATTNISIIPYVAGLSSVDRQVSPRKRTTDLNAGFDAKIGVTPSLNLDLTVNPDFSQVEVDQQVINLTRFEFRFPERRQFFLENSDLFDQAGYPSARPFFSRRVGLTRDTSNNIQQVPILYGARLSGSINKEWRVSALNMLTQEKEELGLPNQLYTVATVQRNFWKQSNISVTYVEKQSLGVTRLDSIRYFNRELWQPKVKNNDTTWVLNDYNRVLTTDLELLSSDNRWYGSFYYSASFDPHMEGKNQSGFGFINYRSRNFQAHYGEAFIQENYNAEAGFVPTRGVYPGFQNSFTNIEGIFYPDSKHIVRMGPSLNAEISRIPGGSVADKSLSLGYGFNFRNTSELEFSYFLTYQKLTNSFNPIDGEKYTSFLEGEDYTWAGVGIGYRSDQRKIFNFSTGINYGGFYNGNLLNVNGSLNYRYQPIGSVAIRYDYNAIDLPENYGKEKLFLIGPRIDLTFTDKIFLTTFVQYNNLADNINLNARFQWRYKPASDFFVVYTENYLPQHLASKNRALVFKLTYWFNL
jgi:hypothetical protein